MVNDNRSSEEFLAWVLDAHANGYGHGKPLSVAIDELCRGKKANDWIWYVFPQVEGLGSSETSQRFWVRRCSDMSVLLGDATALANFTSAFGLAAAALAKSPTSRLRDVFADDEKKVVSSAALFVGYLDRHPRADATALHIAAQELTAIATRDGLSCAKTAEFLLKC